MSDLFEEVEGQLRSDRYRQLLRRLLPYALGLVAVALVAVLGYWGWDHLRQQAISKASEQYQAATEAFVAGDRAKAVQLWTEVSESRAKGYKALALMHLGAVALGERKTDEAVRLFDQAAEAAPDEVVGDVARLKSAFALLDTHTLQEVEARLKPLTEPDRPYRVQAREALAFALLNAGDTAGARREFNIIVQGLDSPDTAQARARAAVALIDAGSAKAVPAVTKAAVALPPVVAPQPGASAPSGASPAQPQAIGPQ